MEVIYGLIPGMLLLGLVAVVVLFWAARSGQFDDLEGDGQRILMDEDADAEEARRFPDAEIDRKASSQDSASSGEKRRS
ncbi:cbb3-type cytochrome oxidase assembly protein CcoS [Lamprobacter modestohalophilus]|uniref:cbb3-type cytochrome oxidase assembly protein CcoS n=1 Tax=Lamprobacter modestohalophilus TaxID=1064514 RepID=UPI002ADEC691|nr:cbb3-type cytochrome oxidase assembly protein CcoS [Lamprobacter modestohalophilus]MEA1049557.1 cbb3-type cytochrome oxidase assembly protein CcoS [Lamprobacter modestohalophilus]